MEKSSIKNKVAIITGGGGVLCSSFAKELAKEKVKVAILDLNKKAAEDVAKNITNNNGIAIGLEANVLDLDSLNKAKKEINNEFGPCDILINGAGGNHPKATTTKEYLFSEDLNNSEIITFFNLDAKGIEFVFNLNFLGTLLPTQVFSKEMKKGSTIINISSMNAFTPLTKIPAYSAAKAAISNFTKWLSVHMSKMEIRVNAIAPGFFLTDQNKSLLTNEDGSFTKRAEKILNNTPMGRFGKPEELAGTLLWLADEEKSSFVNGAVIPVDGGFSAYSGV